MTPPDTNEVNFFLTWLSSADVQERATALRSQANRPLADPRLLALAEELLADTTLCRLEIPLLYGEVRWRAAQAVAALRAVLGKADRVELHDVPVPLSPNEIGQLAYQHGVTASRTGYDAMFDRLEQLRERGLVPRRDIVEDPAFYREPA